MTGIPIPAAAMTDAASAQASESYAGGIAAALATLVELSDAVVEAMARSLIIEDDAGDADGILAAITHAGDCPFVDSPASYTCARCQGDHYRQLARAAWRAGMAKALGRTE